MRRAGRIIGLWLALGACARVVAFAPTTLLTGPKGRTLPAGKAAWGTWGGAACAARRGGDMARVARRGPGSRMQVDVGGGLFQLERLATQGVAAELQHLSPTSVLLIFAAGEGRGIIRCTQRVRPDA
jgi:hypothetical protein